MRKRLILAVLLSVAAVAAPASERFQSKRCRCSFLAPEGWVVVSDAKSPCVFGLRPKVWPPNRDPDDDRDFGESAITVGVTKQRFRDAARDAFFYRVDELRKEWDAPDLEPFRKPVDYVLIGRQFTRHDATWIRSPNWFGLRGQAAVGYYGRGGTGYRGMDHAYRAVLSTGYWRTAIIIADNPFTESEFNAVVQSFAFE